MTQYRIESIENLGIKACLSHYSRKTGLSGRIRNNKGINACGNNQCPSGCRLNLNYLTRCNCRLRCIKNPTNLNWITAFCSTGCCCSSDSHRSGNTGISQTTPCRVSLAVHIWSDSRSAAYTSWSSGKTNVTCITYKKRGGTYKRGCRCPTGKCKNNSLTRYSILTAYRHNPSGSSSIYRGYG